MNNWQDDLLNKFNMIKKEDKNDVSDRSRTWNSNRNHSNSSRNIGDKISIEKKQDININKEKGGKIMITAQGLFDDLKAIDTDPKYNNDYERLSAKIEKLAKVILNCRTNTVRVMDKLGIPREEPKAKKEEVK